jgi:hypothetical protein
MTATTVFAENNQLMLAQTNNSFSSFVFVSDHADILPEETEALAVSPRMHPMGDLAFRLAYHQPAK